MASVQFSPISLRLPESTAGNRKHPSSAAFNTIKRPISVSFSATSPESAPEAPEKPEIELEFVGPKPGADGKYPVESARAVSGEKLLRNIMSDNKIELYAAYILEGQDLLNERTNTELRYLKKKPESWRLACQTIVGNKENSGKVLVQRLPQWKK